MRLRNEPSYQQQSRLDRKNGKNEAEMFGEKEIKERKTPLIFPEELFISVFSRGFPLTHPTKPAAGFEVSVLAHHLFKTANVRV